MRWLLTGGAALVLGVVFVLVTFYASVNQRAALDETRPGDVAVVLGSAVERGGRPSPSLRVRTQHAIDLYRRGTVSTLFLSGGLGRNAPTEAAVMRQLALAAGVPDSALVLDERATSTQQSIDNAATAARAYGWRTVLVVTEPFHTLRARRMARDAGLDAYASPTPNSAIQRIDRLRRYYTARESLALLWYFTAGRVISVG